jgi:hypothetical protein
MLSHEELIYFDYYLMLLNNIMDEFNFLLKSDHAAFGVAPDLLTTISGEPKEFHFFGCSLGDTDNAHFLDFFSPLRLCFSEPTCFIQSDGFTVVYSHRLQWKDFLSVIYIL